MTAETTREQDWEFEAGPYDASRGIEDRHIVLRSTVLHRFERLTGRPRRSVESWLEVEVRAAHNGGQTLLSGAVILPLDAATAAGEHLDVLVSFADTEATLRLAPDPARADTGRRLSGELLIPSSPFSRPRITVQDLA